MMVDPSDSTAPHSAHQPDSVTPPSVAPSAYEILRAIRRIVQSITIHSKHLYRQSGLTVPQLLCLRAVGLSQQPEVTAADVAREVQLTPATVTGILDRLERDGLIKRERRSRDRRKICLSITEAGRQHMQPATPTLHDRFVVRLMSLDEQQRRALLASLEHVVDMIEASSIDAAPILVTGDISKEPSA